MALRLFSRSPIRTHTNIKPRVVKPVRKYADQTSTGYNPHADRCISEPVTYSGNESAFSLAFPSGIRVITSHGPETGIASVGVHVYSGSCFENDSNNGVSYLLKRLAPLGNAKTTQAQRAADVERTGGSIKIDVSRELTSFVGEGLPEAVPTLMRVISDIVHPQQFTNEQIETAKKLVLADKKALSIEAVMKDYMYSAAFQGTPYAQSPLGENASLKSLTSASVEDFVTKNYSANRITVVGTGIKDYEGFMTMAEKLYCDLPKAILPIPDHPVMEYTGSEIKIRDDSFHNLHVAIGYEAPELNSPQYWICLVLQEILSSWDFYHGSAPYNTSRVGETFAIEKLGTKFHTFLEPYYSNGLFGMYFVTHEGDADDATYEAMNSLQKIATTLSEVETEGARNRVIAKFLRNTGANKNRQLGLFGLHAGRALPTAEIVARINHIDCSLVRHFIREWLTDVDPTLIWYGPTGEAPEYNNVRAWTYWSRL